MTVKELKEKLNKYSDNTKVTIDYGGTIMAANGIYVESSNSICIC